MTASALLTTNENSKPPSCEPKKLFVLCNFTSLEAIDCIKNQLKEASTDVIIVKFNHEGDDTLMKSVDRLAEELSEYFTRGCDQIIVSKLQQMSNVQRMVYGLLKADNIIPHESHRNAFCELSRFSKGQATVVRILASLLQIRAFTTATQHTHVNESSRLQQICHTLVPVMPTTEHCVDENLHKSINGLLNDNISLPAQCLLHCLSIVGSMPLPKFFIDELDKLITESFTLKENEQQGHGAFSGLLVNQLLQAGVIIKFPNPIVYHKDFDPQSLDLTIQQMYIPELIRDATKSLLDKKRCIKHVQLALKNILHQRSMVQANKSHLYYTSMLCIQLYDICACQKLDAEVVIESLNLVKECYQKGIV